jgi:D-beta-D-heptose 7-phosphate kinase/D-beta-D-heptose 1-phosphate adenosyltransferase
MVRVDREERSQISRGTERRIISSIKDLITDADAVILSDYGKGLLTDEVLRTTIASAKKQSIPVLVDPKGSDYHKYKGVTVITPNKKEAQIASKIDIVDSKSLTKAGLELLKMVQSKYVLITKGRDGMALFSKGSGKMLNIPAIPREVFDITGAGDTVISTLSLAFASSIPLRESLMLSNYAASIAITKIGTAPVYLDELNKCLTENIASHRKIRSRFELKEILKKKKGEGNKVVFTNGCFDILHVGHIRYLEEAKKFGDILVVGLNSDSSVKKLKGMNRPYLPQNDRAEILAALEPVDFVTIFSENTPVQLISELKPDVHVKGGDYKSLEQLPEAKVVSSYGGKVVLVSEIKDRSTTSIINKIKRSG